MVLKVPYEKLIGGGFFEKFVCKNFHLCFAKCGPKKNGRRLFLMDNDPSHTSNAARQAMQDIEAEFDKIPSRSQDFNPVENISHLMRKNLEHEAIEPVIHYQSNEHFLYQNDQAY